MRYATLLFGFGLALAGCFGTPERMEQLEDLESGGEYQVLGVVDVDTLAIDIDGDGEWDPTTETVRLLGVRGPVYDEQAGRMEYPSREAVAFLQTTLQNQWVVLEDDRREEGLYRQDPPPEFAVTEDYRQLTQGGPWLAYAYVGDVMVQRELLERGYAWVRDEVPCNRMRELRDAEERAKRKSIGVWEFKK